MEFRWLRYCDHTSPHVLVATVGYTPVIKHDNGRYPVEVSMQWFPEMGVTLNHPFYCDLNYKPSIMGILHFRKSPCLMDFPFSN